MRKLRDRRGITLTEMLCTVLIVLLLTALLVVGIRFASKTYTCLLYTSPSPRDEQ